MWCLSRVSRILGVRSGCGPSSKVKSSSGALRGAGRPAAAAAGRPRCRGRVEGQAGGIGEGRSTQAWLAEHVGQQGNTALFDFEVEGGEAGVDVRTTGGCLRFDLWIDGKHRPEHA